MVTCGSVDDGKSTLIGRLLFETDSVPLDTLEVAKNTRRSGSIIPIGQVDFSLLTDGLEAEREQGITIDVAYRSLELKNGNRLLIADSPGHEQYTRNMAVAAAQADVAIVMVDASRQVTSQTKRHLSICSLLRVEKIIIAINKMDIVGYDEKIYLIFKEEITEVAHKLDLRNLEFIPMSALTGENVVRSSTNLSWFSGLALIDVLEKFEKVTKISSPRMQIQNIVRENDFRGVAGRVRNGDFKIGDKVKVLPSGKKAVISKIINGFNFSESAEIDSSPTIVLEPDVDASRGDLLVSIHDSIYKLSTSLRAALIWMDEREMVLNRSYILIFGSYQAPAMILNILNLRNIELLEQVQGDSVKANDIFEAEILIDQGINIDYFENSKDFGSFILVDRSTADTVAAGMVLESAYNENNLSKFDFEIDYKKRAALKHQNPKIVWLTGLSGSGKSTIANALEKELFARNVHSYVLDGDNLRSGLSKDLGFSPKDRAENVRRVSEVARILFDAGLFVIVALVSPFEVDRENAKSLFPDGIFNLVWVNTPVQICAERDPKGLYKKAAEGQISNMTGFGQDYEPPISPDLILDGQEDLDISIKKIIENIL